MKGGLKMGRNNLLLKSTIKHRINGRIRLRCEALKYLSNYKDEIEEKMKSSSFVDTVAVNTIIGSVLINYKEDVDENRVINFIDGIIAEYDIKAVSYTHLDVYKRQESYNGSNTTYDTVYKK